MKTKMPFNCLLPEFCVIYISEETKKIKRYDKTFSQGKLIEAALVEYERERVKKERIAIENGTSKTPIN